MEPIAPPELQLFGDPEFWNTGSVTRADTFTRLRDEYPVSFMDEPEIPVLGQGPGFFAVTRFEDILHVSSHADTFCSGRGTNIPDLPPGIDEFMGSIINMDAPRHTRLRKIVNRAFTPRQVEAIEADVRAKARRIIADMVEIGDCDVVENLSAALPLQVICQMMGIPKESWHRVFELTNVILGGGDPEYTPDLETLMAGVLELAQMGQEVGEDRLKNPTDDLVSAIMHAEVDGERLTPQEMASFFILLCAAGNETTRTATSHGLYQLSKHPDQRAAWQNDVAGMTTTAIEEIVRYSTPVIHFRRTATHDTNLRGIDIPEGSKVVMFYESGNRDERRIEDPFRFDITRSPNEHVAFGAAGPHFCLGANLARRELSIIFEEVFRWLPDLEITSEPDYLQSSFIHGIKRMRCSFTPTKVDLDA
ncbi:MAG TPA: cytochrome P450 [Microthrixaceae bacterium]|nr:cytochrome P450 [Microthrixaceae bacterium]